MNHICDSPPTYQLKIQSPSFKADITSTVQEQSQEASYAVANYCQIPAQCIKYAKTK